MLSVGAILLGACAGEVTAPAANQAPASQAAAMFVPSAADKALVGVADGSYSVTFDPTQNQAFNLGPNRLSMPANSICDLHTSGYGADYWNRACTPQTLPITLVVTIRNAATPYPSIDFSPAMRFSPSKAVQLFMYAPHVSATDGKHWLMAHCSDAVTCVDESDTDVSLATNVDHNANVLSRRVKHFSGYTVAERDTSGTLTYSMTTTTTTTTTKHK